uniref:43 kDa tail protein n=1 Tax=Siphoviridae sp. ctvok7 TaxID=2827596 RepID=A0A8S5LLW9_9CAUD|nr:MAG TPA: 43 kDa tail protein [Siphoviridae sp. ctvok7]
MKTELLIQNKGSGKMWELSNSVESVSWSTERTGSSGKLEFSVVKAGDLSFTEGDPVRFSVDGQLQFYGWVFTKSKDRWGVIDVTCYDRLRYLKANGSYNFYDRKVGDMIREIAADLQVDVSTLADTGYAIPSFCKEDESCLDIIGEAVQQTLLNTGDIYVFYDDGNGLALRRPEDMISNVVIGENSLVTDYTYETDIDEQTYNSVKLARPNEDTGRADVLVVQDSFNIGNWGLLQLYQTVDGDVNDAQMREQAQRSLEYYNRRKRSLKVESLGVPGLRAGQMVLMKIPGLGDINLDQYVLLDKVDHTWENGTHTMNFETLVILRSES